MKVVYKFRDWKNKYHRKILTENEIYLAPPNKINDPFDCRINEDFSLLSEKEIEQYVDDQLCFYNLDNTPTNRNKIKKKYINPENLTKNNKKTYKEQCKNIGIFSCCQDINGCMGWENILLWSHYSNEHKGFCVVFWKEKLNDYINTHGDIKYRNYPKLKPLAPIEKNRKKIIKNYKTLLSTKEKRWKYENEYRYIKIYTKNKNYSTGFENKDRIINLSDDCIAGVFLGVHIHPKHKKEILILCNQKGIPLFQTSMNQFDFTLRKERIN